MKNMELVVLWFKENIPTAAVGEEEEKSHKSHTAES